MVCHRLCHTSHQSESQWNTGKCIPCSQFHCVFITLVHKDSNVVDHGICYQMGIFQPQNGRHWLGSNVGDSMSHTITVMRQVWLFSPKFCLQNEQLWVPVKHSEAIINNIRICKHITSDAVCKRAKSTETIQRHSECELMDLQDWQSAFDVQPCRECTPLVTVVDMTS